MPDSVVVHGYRFSVYTRIAHMILRQKDVAYTAVEVNPFSDPIPEVHLQMHPFGRVPILSHGAFQIYETAAIGRYIDLAFDGSRLVPADSKQSAAMAQVVSIVDNYGYWPMVRQVASQRVFAPLQGQPADEVEILRGLKASRLVLSALDKIACEGLALDAKEITLADCHLAPMVAYFVQAAEGEKELRDHESLNRWWRWIIHQQSFIDTELQLPDRHSS